MSLGAGLGPAVQALEAALAQVRSEVEAQEGRVKEAEFGPHGRADVIQAESERLDRLRDLQDRLESTKDEVSEIRNELEAL